MVEKTWLFSNSLLLKPRNWNFQIFPWNRHKEASESTKNKQWNNNFTSKSSGEWRVNQQTQQIEWVRCKKVLNAYCIAKCGKNMNNRDFYGNASHFFSTRKIVALNQHVQTKSRKLVVITLLPLEGSFMMPWTSSQHQNYHFYR